MRRPVKPATGSRSRYPRLNAAWRLLLGAAPLYAASPALADVTPPPQPGTGASSGSGDGKQVPCPNKLPGTTVVPVQAGTAGSEHVPMRTAGVMIRPVAPKPPKVPSKVNKPKSKDAEPAAGKDGEDWRVSGFELHVELVVHPHGPDEPCRGQKA